MMNEADEDLFEDLKLRKMAEVIVDHLPRAYAQRLEDFCEAQPGSEVDDDTWPAERTKETSAVMASMVEANILAIIIKRKRVAREIAELKQTLDATVGRFRPSGCRRVQERFTDDK